MDDFQQILGGYTMGNVQLPSARPFRQTEQRGQRNEVETNLHRYLKIVVKKSMSMARSQCILPWDSHENVGKILGFCFIL
jgi:hypothetical protein